MNQFSIFVHSNFITDNLGKYHACSWFMEINTEPRVKWVHAWQMKLTQEIIRQKLF